MASAMVAHSSGASSAVPGKIVIRGTSKLSLKDRFTRLSSELQQQQSVLKYEMNDPDTIMANRRLAQDMGNRPEVVAALNNQRKSVLQRLGVKGRLGIPANYNRGYQQQNGFSPFRQRFRGGYQFPYFNRGGFNPNRLGQRNYGPKRLENGRFGYAGFAPGSGRGGYRKPFFRGGWRGRGGRRGGGNQFDRMSREELDRQLDEYMSKAKMNLDNDLDAYMGDAIIG